MNKKKIYNLFDTRFELRGPSNGWYRFKFGQDDSMSVNFDIDRVKSFRHHYKITTYTFLSKFIDNPSKAIEEYKEKEFTTSQTYERKSSLKMPNSYKGLEEKHPLQSRFIKYLKDRDLDIEFLIERGVGYCTEGKYFGRIMFPFLNPSLEYYLGRTIFDEATPKYLNPEAQEVGVGKSEIIYNEIALHTQEMVYLGEGVLDALIWEDKGIASLGWKLSQTQLNKIITSSIKTIYICPDSGFYLKSMSLCYKLSQHKEVFVCNLEEYPEGTDIPDIGKENVTFDKFNINLYEKALHNYSK